MLYSRHKVDVIELLDGISKRVTRTPRPITTIVTNNVFQGNINVDSLVFKREASDCSEHVLIPPHADERLQAMLSNTGEFPWFYQPFLPFLRSLGEWRVYVLGGRPMRVVRTIWQEVEGMWENEIVTSGYSLEEIKK